MKIKSKIMKIVMILFLMFHNNFIKPIHVKPQALIAIRFTKNDM